MSQTELAELVDVFRILKRWRDEHETALIASAEEPQIATGTGLH